jgi:hypothetical protein
MDGGYPGSFSLELPSTEYREKRNYKYSELELVMISDSSFKHHP